MEGETMKKVVLLTLVLTLVAGTAMAADMAKRIGLGFVNSDAPIGGRYWVSEKIGLDLGFGLSSIETQIDSTRTETLTNWQVFGALPIKIHSVGDNRVNFNFLPGVMFSSVDNGEGGDSTKESTTDIHLTGSNLTEFGFHYYLPGGE
jgi:hypothetical protein